MAGDFHGSSTSLIDAHHNPMPSYSSSSSSFLTTPFKSELISINTDTDTEDDDSFILELSRQIEDYMLQDDDDHNKHNNTHVVNNQIHNQHRVVENSKSGRWKMTESTQQMKYYRGRRGTSSSGSGMRAVFLNRSGSKTGSNGTGVFLPPSANNPTAQGCKTPGTSFIWFTNLINSCLLV
ncbi:hypothetical protein M8C21_025191 [Ambrosia artemisiifolia]|uniref:Uncharacterized protein n=1 Tax=Ambrosia artemisiifolia TaxID=4212 RepID=A0AAD5BNF2_AMBAR|nr:hypothetical protein M8C21_025191 [Ambrosia artemisiifolia]